jgi:hypothetical protein
MDAKDSVRVSEETARGCGFRKPGGLYLVTDPLPLVPCGKLPLPLGRCPVCSCGLSPARGYTWIAPGPLFGKTPCAKPSFPDVRFLASAVECGFCPLRDGGPALSGRHGLLWIGESFYPTPANWIREARERGVSRRIARLPKGFVLGETFVFVAHRQAVPGPDPDDPSATIFSPGIFHVFRPSRVEYVVEGTETAEDLDRMRARGIEPVRVVPVEDERQLPLFPEATPPVRVRLRLDCLCGHAEENHRGSVEAPTSSACDLCDCLLYDDGHDDESECDFKPEEEEEADE